MDVSFADWTARLAEFNKYIAALADFKLKASQAALNQAKADGIQWEIRKQQLVMRQLQTDLRIFNRARGSLNREQAAMRARAKRVLTLMRGRRISPKGFHSSWIAYTWFEARALLSEGGDALYDVEVSSRERTAANFVPIASNKDPIAAPDEIENGLQLVDWLREMRFMAKSGSRAQRVVAKVLSVINQVAKNDIDEMQTRIEAMRDDTYDAWNLPSILGVTANAAARRLQDGA